MPISIRWAANGDLYPYHPQRIPQWIYGGSQVNPNDQANNIDDPKTPKPGDEAPREGRSSDQKQDQPEKRDAHKDQGKQDQRP